MLHTKFLRVGIATVLATTLPLAFAVPGWAGVMLNGVMLNGLNLNGLNLNGVNLNGVNLNGVMLNGVMLNGVMLNGVMLNGTESAKVTLVDPTLAVLRVEGGQLVIETAADN